MLPSCVKTCTGDALHFGPKSTIYEMAEERAEELRPSHPDVTVYGADRKTFFGGLGNVYVLPEDLSFYDL